MRLNSFSLKVIELRYIQHHEEQEKILRACHVDPTAGHMGVKKTVNRITERFMWPGIVKAVKEMVCFTKYNGSAKMIQLFCVDQDV